MKLINAVWMIEKCKKSFSLLIILLTIAVSGCTVKETVNNTSMAQTPIETITHTPYPLEKRMVYVEIFGSAFNPSELNVVNGTTVQWTNKDSAQHAVYINNISSPKLNKRERWNYTFNIIGTFEYNCTLHSWMPHGHIIVR